jgi:hypothetical protein
MSGRGKPELRHLEGELSSRMGQAAIGLWAILVRCYCIDADWNHKIVLFATIQRLAAPGLLSIAGRLSAAAGLLSVAKRQRGL